jgi:hypothetical protein
MSEGYHPEVDDSSLCTVDDSSKYRSIIACCIWIIVLGRFDISYATSVMSRFNMLPREGHLTSYPDHSKYPVEDHSNWVEFYPDSGEEIPKGLPPEKVPRVMMTAYVYVDADRAHDLVTRRSIT